MSIQTDKIHTVNNILWIYSIYSNFTNLGNWKKEEIKHEENYWKSIYTQINFICNREDI